MDLTVAMRESDDGKGQYVVVVRRPKENPYGACRIDYVWEPAGLDELNEICKRLGARQDEVRCTTEPWNG